MSKIDKHIEELLHDHDCVIIPEFGGFITSKKPAYYNSYTSIFYPATKKILFNKHLVYNDGLLATQIAKRRSWSVEEATQSLLEFKDDCFLRLDEEGRVEIERVGVLFFDKEKNIQFHQASTNFLKDSFGLGSLSLEKVKETVVKEKAKEHKVELSRIDKVKVDRKPTKEVLRTEKQTERKRNRIGTWIPMLILPLMLAGFYVGKEKGLIGEKTMNLASFNPFSGTYVDAYTPRDKEEKMIQLEVSTSDITVENYPRISTSVFEEIGRINVDLVDTEETSINSLEIIPEKIDSTYNKIDFVQEELKYHVIVGCFSIKSNAENLVKSWKEKGYNSTIVDKKGSLYRASIQSFSTRKEAKTFLKEIKKNYSNSLWVLKK